MLKTTSSYQLGRALSVGYAKKNLNEAKMEKKKLDDLLGTLRSERINNDFDNNEEMIRN